MSIFHEYINCFIRETDREKERDRKRETEGGSIFWANVFHILSLLGCINWIKYHYDRSPSLGAWCLRLRSCLSSNTHLSQSL